MLVSNYPNVSINTANPPTEMARRDAVRRDLFEPVKEAEKSGAEKPLVSDEKARTPGNSQNVNLYDARGKETETQQAIEGQSERETGQEDKDSRGEQSSQQNGEQQATAQQKQAEQQEQKQIQELKSRDLEVKQHEQAHAAIGGRYAGAPSYSYEKGPDGKQYAVGGEVPIDVSPVSGDPQATVQKMQQVRAAALAPAEPSAADRRIAAEAAQRQVQAQAELVEHNSAVTQTKENQSPERGGNFSEQTTQTDISYSVTDNNGSSAIIYPQRDTLASSAQMQLRRNVIAGFYQHATEPQIKQYLQQV